MKPWKLAALCSLVFATVALAGQPALVTQEATGEAAIVDGNKEAAFDEARRKAMREAVEQVVGVMVSAETLTRNNQLVSDRILSNSAGYVRDVKVLSRQEEDGVMKVTIRAQVGTAELDKDLQAVQALIRRLESTRLVILTQEQAIDSHGVTTSSGVLATELTEGFKRDGWTLLDPNFAAGKLKLSAGVSLGSTEAKEIGELSKADYILYGNVNFRYQPPIGLFDKDASGNQTMFNVTGEYDLAIFATDSGSQLAKIVGKFNTGDMGKGGSNVLSYERTAHDIAVNKGKAIVAEVRRQVVEYLRSAEQNGNRLVMSVVGLPDFGAVQDFKRVLEGMTGMREVKKGNFASRKAQFELTFVGTADELAEKLSSKNFKGKRISVTGATANTVELTLGK